MKSNRWLTFRILYLILIFSIVCKTAIASSPDGSLSDRSEKHSTTSNCGSAGTCPPGTRCSENTCIPARCYSPCREGFKLSDGSYVACSPEGLLLGCVGGSTCIEGSCVAEGSGPRLCKNELDCPDFQTCSEGRCYSNCEYTTDCAQGFACYRKVCRKQCSSMGMQCDKGQHCFTADGENGFCLPLANPDTRQTQVPGTFSVSTESIQMSNTKTSSEIKLTNQSIMPFEFTIKKIRHIEYADKGPKYVTETPLHWIKLGVKEESGSTPSGTSELKVIVDGNGGKKTITVEGARNSTLPRWDGVLEVSSSQLGNRSISISYSEQPDGRWSGKIYYFSMFGDTNLQKWIAQGRPEDAGSVGNALLHKWVAFKYNKNLTFDEWKAILTSLQTGSWDWKNVSETCKSQYPHSQSPVCYPMESGVAAFTSNDKISPIPTGVIEYPFAANLKITQQASVNETNLKGRIESSGALHYSGNPGFELKLQAEPTQCTRKSDGICINDLTSLRAEIQVGGRYLTDTCDAPCLSAGPDKNDFFTVKQPWLVPGLGGGTAIPSSDQRYRCECRDSRLPFGKPEQNKDINLAFAASNPVPDGNTRWRTMELVDGALINSSSMFILFKETFKSFLSTDASDNFSAYGYMLLERRGADLGDLDYVGSQVADPRPPRNSQLANSCDKKLLNKLGLGDSVTETNANLAVRLLITGELREPNPGYGDKVIKGKGEGEGPFIHYACVTSVPQAEIGSDNNPRVTAKTVSYLDRGAGIEYSQQTGLPDGSCPAGSTVRFFAFNKRDDSYVQKLPCQQDGTCGPVVFDKCAKDPYAVECDGFIADPIWRCDNNHSTGCDDRSDLRNGKVFFIPKAQNSPIAAFLSLDAANDQAFRYKSRFKNREGSGLGFSPSICSKGSDALPYCYDPDQAEESRERISCLVEIFNNFYDKLSDSPFDNSGFKPRPEAREALTIAFSWWPNTANSAPQRDGFERLYSELAIMLGDDAYAAAFASRFDLAGGAVFGFEGSLFEPQGINLSGGAGFEMYKLYQAVQYYQLALDRFYSLAPSIWASIQKDDPNQRFVTLSTVVAYFDRLVRASTQKARASSEIAKRYLGFNRPDLARSVIERSYGATYMESAILSHLMLRMKNVVRPADWPQVAKQIKLAAFGYRSALLDMQTVYDGISTGTAFFGFSPDYVPFPALDAGESNAFVKTFSAARPKAAVAAEKEEKALLANRSYETDRVFFQNELTRIRNTYEDRLAQICGTMKGDDGRIYPSISKYAYLNNRASVLGDPCGFAGNGQIHDAILATESSALNLRGVRQAAENVIANIAIEKDRVSQQCEETKSMADYEWEQDNRVRNLETEIRATQTVLSQADRAFEKAGYIAMLTKCMIIAGTAGGSDCPAAGIAAVALGVAALANELAHTAGEVYTDKLQYDIANIQAATKRWKMEKNCRLAEIDLNARTASMLLELKNLEIETLKAEKNLGIAVAGIERLRQEAQRLQAEQSETEAMTIDLEAARNNPNVRIYKNDAILNADRTFTSAAKEAYKATKVYEYYTSQPYNRLGDLFLVRMVSSGDITLESYLEGLEDSYKRFEEQYGNPDLRVAIVSLRDDVLQIPRFDDKGQPRSERDRIQLLRNRLKDSKLLDESGYTTLPFGTSLDQLSPLTRNHKVVFVEAEIIGSDIGDPTGRLYLRQKGTGVVRGVSGKKDYFVLPARTAVINPFFNGQRVYGPEVYRNYRLRDRPFANSLWEVVLNQRDETVNLDINIDSLTDIRMYLYYTDFTAK